MTFSFIFIMDIIGTIAFASSGAMEGIRKNMDIFGINILALATAVGGGILRDIFIGQTPPVMFTNPIYAAIACATANIVFAVIYFNRKPFSQKHTSMFESLFFWCDALGLAAFTVDGVNAGINLHNGRNIFLFVFMGSVTGVGGGLIRDIMANRTPQIFVKHIYALVSVIGALITSVSYMIFDESTSVIIGFISIILIRCAAARYKLNLPRIKHK